MYTMSISYPGRGKGRKQMQFVDDKGNPVRDATGKVVRFFRIADAYAFHRELNGLPPLKKAA